MKCVKCSENNAAYFISRGGGGSQKIGFCETCSEDIGIFSALRKVESLLHGYGMSEDAEPLFANDNFPLEFADKCGRCGTDLREFERRFCFGCEECALVFGSLISNYLSLFGAVPALSSYPGTPPRSYLEKAKKHPSTKKAAKALDALKPVPAVSAKTLDRLITDSGGLAENPNPWMASLVELRRNFSDMIFPTRMPPESLSQSAESILRHVPEKMRSKLRMLTAPNSSWHDVRALEARLYGRKLFPGSAVATDESLSNVILINNMDHMTYLSATGERSPGAALKPTRAFARELEKTADIAYSARFGYLTSAPRHMGSGLSVSVLLHLPYSLFRSRTYDYPRLGLEKSVRFEPMSGNNFERHGFFRVSSSLAFGRNDLDFTSEVFSFAAELAAEEEKIRNDFSPSERNRVDNIMKKALHNAKMSYRLSYQDSLRLTSFISLGVDCDVVELPLFKIDDVFPGLSSARIMRGAAQRLSVNDCEKLRADMMAALVEKWSGLVPIK